MIAAILALSLLAAPARAGGQQPAPQPELQLPLTLLDAPFNLREGYHAPSMQQSLDLAWGVDRLALLGLREGFGAMLPEREGLRTGLGIAAAGALSGGLVFVGGWMHKEWHRAVMTSQGISSRNGIYHPEAWSQGTISVDQVLDEDLARLKADAHAATVRLMEAGLESERALVERFGDELFFHGAARRNLGPLVLVDSWAAPVIAMTEISGLLYLAACTDPGLDELVDGENERLDTVAARDFTGPDCTAWVHDLFHPDEPFEDRGLHPSGVGVDRYLGWSDLDAGEQAYLQRQLGLRLLNLLNPHLYGVNGFGRGQGEDRWGGGRGHVLTPWGYSLDAHLARRRAGLGGKLTLHNGLAAAGWFPGLDVEVLDLPLHLRRFTDLSLDAGLGVWVQPADLRHDGAERQPGGRVDARLSWRATPWLDLWLEADAKSAGWVLGQVELGPAVGGRLGVAGLLR